MYFTAAENSDVDAISSASVIVVDGVAKGNVRAVVFIGYPTWWYDLPQMMYSFFDEYGFSGKTIIPFNSANGSQFSRTIGTIQQLEPEAKVITDGLSVHQNRVSGAQSEVEDWIKRLGF